MLLFVILLYGCPDAFHVFVGLVSIRFPVQPLIKVHSAAVTATLLVYLAAVRTSKFGPSEKKVNILFEPREHFFISKKGGGAEGAAPFFDL